MAISTFLGVRLAPLKQLFVFGLLAVFSFSSYVSALSYVAGSKCESVCSDSVAGTVHDDVRCLDQQFDVTPGSHLKECVSCQLNSTAVDPVTRMTDVQWGLFHLRYILSNCMFAYPEERVSISSPCQVSCAPLKRAVTFGITNSSTSTDFSGDLGFCTGGQFDDFTLNNCAFCYSFIPQQLILGNFLQALHIACHAAPAVGKAFYPDGVTIFNQSAIAGPTGPSAPSASHHLTGTSLILAIVLPLVGGLIILIGGCCCCWHFTRKRRAMMASSGRMSRFHDGQVQEYSPMTPKGSPPQPYAWNEPPREMQSITAMPKAASPPVMQSAVSKQDAATAQGRWAKHAKDESSTPLTSPDRTSYVRGDDSGVANGDYKDPNLHTQYEDQETPPAVFRAQDGFVKEETHGGWAR